MHASATTLPPVDHHDSTLWYNRRFTDPRGHTLYCLGLICQGVLHLSQPLSHDIQMLPHTYKSTYRHAHKRMSSAKGNDPQPYHCSYFWKPWLTRHVANVLSPKHGCQTQYTNGLWRSWHALPIPEQHKQQILLALWDKLPIVHRLRHWKPTQHLCLVDHSETIHHVLYE